MPVVPLIGPEREDSETLRAVGHDRLQPSLWQSIKAATGEELTDYGPTGSTLRLREQAEAEGAPVTFNTPGGLIEVEQAELPGRIAPSPLAEDEWGDSKWYRPGLTWHPGMTAESAALLAERHDTRKRREDVLAREPGGVLRGGAILAARFAAQAADPIGLAASFVPVVGQVRHARLVATMGRVGARATTGAIEGAVGNALLEPVVLAAARRDQLDYDAADSLIAVGMGGLFGAGIRTAGGAVADIIRARGRRAHEMAVDVALTQAAAGRDIDVAAVLRAERPRARSFAEPAEVRAERPVTSAEAAKVAADTLARDRETIRRGLAEDATSPRTFAEQRAEAERTLLEAHPSRAITLPSGGQVTRKGPMDLVTWLRTQGGIKDEGGELRALDAQSINRGRDLPFARGEQFLGRLVNDETGLSLDEAARRAAEAGYIGRATLEAAEGGGLERGAVGTPQELVDAIARTLRAGSLEERVWGTLDPDVRAYADTLRAVDENEAFAAPREPEWLALERDGDEGWHPAEGDYGDPEQLWQDEMARAAMGEQPSPRGEGAVATMAPDARAEIEAEAALLDRGFKAAAFCVARNA